MKRTSTKEKPAEESVIGSAMRDKENFLVLAKIVRKAEMFHSFAHQEVWKAFYVMHRNGLPWEPPVLLDVLLQAKVSDEVRADYIIDLWESGRTTADVYNAQIVVDFYVRRTAREHFENGFKTFADPTSNVFEVMDEVAQRFEAIRRDALPSEDCGDDAADNSDFNPFPLNALPSCIGEYAEAGAAALRVDPAFIAVPCLVATGAAIGNSRIVRTKASWPEPSIFWAAVVADSSSLKSPSLDMALHPLG